MSPAHHMSVYGTTEHAHTMRGLRTPMFTPPRTVRGVARSCRLSGLEVEGGAVRVKQLLLNFQGAGAS